MANSRAAHLADELRAARRHRKLTQLQLAELSGVNVHAINRLERAAGRIEAEQIVALAEALAVNADSLLPRGEVA